MKLFKRTMLMCLLAVSGQASAAYDSGTLVAPNAAQPEKKLLILENSLVDLVNGIEILNFNYTLGKSVCDVYKGLTGNVLQEKVTCAFDGALYTELAVSNHDGWRIGASKNILDVVTLFPHWYKPAEWLTYFPANRSAIDFVVGTLGGTRSSIVNGFLENSFEVMVGDNLHTTGLYSSNTIAVDGLRYSGGDTAFRQSSFIDFSAARTSASVLVVRDWLGAERAINSAQPVHGSVFLISAFWSICFFLMSFRNSRSVVRKV